MSICPLEGICAISVNTSKTRPWLNNTSGEANHIHALTKGEKVTLWKTHSGTRTERRLQRRQPEDKFTEINYRRHYYPTLHIPYSGAPI